MRTLPLICALTLIPLAGLASAKPMSAPTLEQALKQSSVVALARYETCDPAGATYFGGVPATYTLLETWRGKLPKGHSKLQVRYDFSDGSACIEPKGWGFDEKLMPKQGQVFVLFLRAQGKTGTYRSFRGSYGRWPADALKKDERKALHQVLRATSPSKCRACAQAHPRLLRRLEKGMIWEARCPKAGEVQRDLRFGFEASK